MDKYYTFFSDWQIQPLANRVLGSVHPVLGTPRAAARFRFDARSALAPRLSLNVETSGTPIDPDVVCSRDFIPGHPVVGDLASRRGSRLMGCPGPKSPARVTWGVGRGLDDSTPTSSVPQTSSAGTQSHVIHTRASRRTRRALKHAATATASESSRPRCARTASRVRSPRRRDGTRPSSGRSSTRARCAQRPHRCHRRR